jgi:hypothetical protein
MKYFFLVLVCLHTTIAWGSNRLDALDGKSIICEANEEMIFPTSGIYGFRFIGREVFGDMIVTDYDKVIISNFYTDSVKSISVNYITWWDEWVLNRESLLLYFQKPGHSEYQCTVAPDTQAYIEEMQRYRLEHLRKLEKLLEKNKL